MEEEKRLIWEERWMQEMEEEEKGRTRRRTWRWRWQMEEADGGGGGGGTVQASPDILCRDRVWSPYGLHSSGPLVLSMDPGNLGDLDEASVGNGCTH